MLSTALQPGRMTRTIRVKWVTLFVRVTWVSGSTDSYQGLTKRSIYSNRTVKYPNKTVKHFNGTVKHLKQSHKLCTTSQLFNVATPCMHAVFNGLV